MGGVLNRRFLPSVVRPFLRGRYVSLDAESRARPESADPDRPFVNLRPKGNPSMIIRSHVVAFASLLLPAGLALVNFGFYMVAHRKSRDDGYLEVFGGSRANPDDAGSQGALDDARDRRAGPPVT